MDIKSKMKTGKFQSNKKQLYGEELTISIPQNVDNLQLPDPSLLQFYKNYDERILWIDDEINEYTLEFAKMIMQWNLEDKINGIKPENRKPIKILFFSPGGSLDVNNCLIDTISLSTTKIIGINAGMAASAGCFIYLSCHERLTFPTAEFLIHQGAGNFSGDYGQICTAIMNYQRQIQELGQFVMAKTNIPEEVFEENFATDWYLSAKEAVEYGVSHRIITSLDEIL